MSKDLLLATQLINFLRQHSAYSRRSLLSKIIDSKVTVNGQIITNAQHTIKPTDTIKINGQIVRPSQNLYYKFHKPIGVISTLRDPKGRPNLSDYLKKYRQSQTLRPIGRLDRDSSGLLLFSNDGDFIQTILHPSYSISKTYEIRIQNPLSNQAKKTLSNGFFLPDGPVEITIDKIISPTHLLVSICMGRNRILRRAFEFLNHPIVSLHRVSIGNCYLNDLAPGQFRALSENEIKALALTLRSW